ncbi:NADPH-dependent glutamate synthase subunit beta-like oxidoreductase [Mycolicibacterium neoaurum]|uniref:NADPH-dependent glutamate synthase subunit beta-like oxidoreductase n=1 Tax=Mycolicibacterium neoaurum TaxID=1795 RepID=A0AAV2WP29_MYCNE|nr:NADPH-dependent glutamate synthase subunit beta-like oxidoreductase [Mycolicibacterium neoaurum]
MVGRRGPLQAPFTTMELRELGHMEQMAEVDVVVERADFDGITDEDLAAADKTVRTNIKVLREYAELQPEGAKRRVVFRFATSPVEIRGTDKVESIVLGRNELVDEGGRVVAKDTGEREELPVQLVVRAVGYRGVAVDGLPFDERSGTIPHENGRIEGREHEYVVGWIKRGPSGVIGSNKKDSADTVETLLADLEEPRFDEGHAQELHDWLLSRQPRLVTDAHWERIDAHERAIGEAQHRPRVKVSNVEKLLGIAHG